MKKDIPKFPLEDCDMADGSVIKRTHFEAISAIANQSQANADAITYLIEGFKDHQDNVVTKLDEIKEEIKKHGDELHRHNTAFALLEREVQDNKEDIKGLGRKISKHSEFHRELEQKKIQSQSEASRMWKQPIMNYVIIAIIGIVFLGVQSWIRDQQSSSIVGQIEDAIHAHDRGEHPPANNIGGE